MALPSLYCFSAVNSSGPELELLRIQFAQGVGIFACNEWGAFSAQRVWLSPGAEATVPVPGPPSKLGKVPGNHGWLMLLNVGMFIRIWDKIITLGYYTRHDWMVKVDPDAVFFPPRLRLYLRSHHLDGSASMYFLNCQTYNSMQGPLEVFSHAATKIFVRGKLRCTQELPWQKMGEDQFMQQCMQLLGVHGVPAFDMLADAKCGQQVNCAGERQVAYHPFKTNEQQWNCRHNLKQAVGPKGLPLLVG